MATPTVAALGNLKGWLIAAGIWAGLVGVYLLSTTSTWDRSRVNLDPAIAEVIRCDVPVETVTGPFTQLQADAADEYHLAVQEYSGTDGYSGYLALLSQGLTNPDELDIRAAGYLLEAAPKAKMDYTRRFAQPQDWTAPRVGFVKAFDGIGQICILKADLLVKADRPAEAEALLKATVAFGYHVEQERLRYAQTITGIAIQKRACRMLAQLYEKTERFPAARTATEYVTALQDLQNRLESKASTTTGVLEDGSPLPGELFWLVDNDKDRMWQIEAVLLLGLTQHTAPRSADQRASRERLASLARYCTDPMLHDAAAAALATTVEDVRKVR